MFLRFVDHHIQLFSVVSNHQSNDEMFVIYRSSLVSMHLILIILFQQVI